MTWTKENTQDLARAGIITVTFKKKNGDIRIMDCTLLEQYLPQQNDLEIAIAKNNPNTCTVWDVSANDWRAFRMDSVISIEASPRKITNNPMTTNKHAHDVITII